ncbi:MAG: CapA family protein [Mycobacterium leprae]
MKLRLRCTALLLILFLLSGCSTPAVKATAPASSGSEVAAPTPPPPPAEHARILATGDFLMHLPLVYSSARGKEQWDFTPLFEPIRPWIEGADLAIGELETTLTGTDYPWSGYPSFNTPPEFARDIKLLGYDAVTNANNHALDYSEYGLKQTADALDRFGVPHVGTNRTPEEQNQILVLNVTKNIKMALLAYTYGTNGIPLPNPWCVNMLDPQRIQADIRRARQMEGVDLVAVALHMGDEYAREPNEQQQELVKLSLEAGADIIFGDHPHVVQRAELQRVTDQFGRDLPRAVVYSFGNLISNQEGMERLEGIMLVVDVVKEQGVTWIEKLSYIPVYTHTYQQGADKHYRTVPIEQALRDYEQGKDPLITAADYAQLKAAWADTTARTEGNQYVTLMHVDQPKAVQR